ncbi:MAG: hypothetical protein RR400_02995 [Clostridia bacterium]
MKLKTKICARALTAAMIVPAGVLLAGCGGPAPLKAKAKDVYAFSAMTSGEYLVNNAGGNSGFSATKFAAADESTIPTAIAGDIKNISTYADMFEGYVLGGGVGPVSAKPTEADGIYSTYKIKLTMNVPTAGGQSSYVLYYNETNTETNTEIEEDVEETETETTLEGVLLVGVKEFTVSGKKEIEVEQGEKESTITFTTSSKENPANFVTVTQSVEVEEGEEEIEFNYLVVNGADRTETTVEWEDDNGEKELSLQFKSTVAGAAQNIKYNIEKEKKDGKDVLKVNYKVNGIKDSFTIETGELKNIFTFSNGKVHEITK